LEWNEAAYKNHNTLYYKFLNTPEKSGKMWNVVDVVSLKRI